MNFILYSNINDSPVTQSLSRPEYSLHLVLKAYRPLFESFGRVHVVSSSAEVDPLYKHLMDAGEDCLFLSFTPPQETRIDLECPTICVLAWEFDSIPDEQWDNDPRQNWTPMLARQGRVITLSNHAAKAIRRAMGENFPVLVLPTPLGEAFANIHEQQDSTPLNRGVTLTVKGCIFDSRLLSLSPDNLMPKPLTPEQEAELEALKPPPLTLKRRYVIARHYLRLWALDLGREQAVPVPRVRFLQNWYWEGIRDLLSDKVHDWFGRRLPNIAGPQAVPTVIEPPPRDMPDTASLVETIVDGVVYVAVLDPTNGSKNWLQILTAFCWAFRDTPDVTLVLKITQRDLAACYGELMTPLAQLAPFACRVVMIHGYQDDQQYARLYDAATFFVNASLSEGLCLPLMEFMACGKPVIAPDHTAMQDYIDGTVAFVVRSSEELTTWPQDTRTLLRTRRYRPDWGSLKSAYENSYRMAKTQPQEYRRMSDAASRRMRDFCASAALQPRVSDFFGLTPQASSTTPVTDNASC